ncbi:UNVERIFIED_CONTAM: hypothetical protein K2H54_052603 [Gekko kuhli]
MICESGKNEMAQVAEAEMEDVIDENTLVGELSVEQFIKMLQEEIQKGIKQAFAKLHDPKVELESFEKSGKLEQEAQNKLEIPTGQQENENRNKPHSPSRRLRLKSNKVTNVRRRIRKRKEHKPSPKKEKKWKKEKKDRAIWKLKKNSILWRQDNLEINERRLYVAHNKYKGKEHLDALQRKKRLQIHRRQIKIFHLFLFTL